MLKVAKIPAIVLLLSFVMGQVAKTEYRYVVLARAVNRDGQPIPLARVFITPDRDDQGGDFVYRGTADAEGHIRFEVPNSSMVKTTRLMYTTGPEPPNAVAVIDPPFDRSRSLTGPSYTARQIQIVKNGESDVGSILVRLFYGIVRVVLQDRLGEPLVTDAGKWRYVWLRIRDERGHVVKETSLSIEQIGQAVNLSESSVRVALPQGIWRVELSENESKGPWIRSRVPLLVTPSSEPLSIYLKSP